MSAPFDPQDPRPGDRTPPPGGPAGQQGYPQQFPSYPAQYSASPQFGWNGGVFHGGTAPQPGVIPLRPLTVGEVLSGAIRVVRGNAGLLLAVAFLGAVVASLLPLLLAALAGPVSYVMDDAWIQEFATGRRTSFPASWIVYTLAGLVVGIVVQTVLSAVSTSVVTRAVIGRPSTGIIAERLRGRWVVLVGVSAVVSLSVAVGALFLVVPGVLIYLAWIVAVPVAVMERTGVGTALRRSAELTRGHRGRIFGTMMAVIGIAFAGTLAVSLVAVPIMGSAGSTSSFVFMQILTVIASGLIGAWSASVVALIYVDLRIRKENLGPSLASAAAQNPPPPAKTG
ncbi:hypothetical protein JL107_11050 [Nakamurella flavida]|uniref:Glycerophosphoryl diester phosphodiesterase membrane domain-containing protein n=1 Tax=Nakamurella flavida TaxID=363630 RepID=A0A939C2V6_9ACTN|nr:hypothetical protein [Nakamurella flavida]MBM9476985.1 hypothetical protein [Nakamurella flavida]MDP9779930.1 hypothetical protein [Nakamurella flavida]